MYKTSHIPLSYKLIRLFLHSLHSLQVYSSEFFRSCSTQVAWIISTSILACSISVAVKVGAPHPQGRHMAFLLQNGSSFDQKSVKYQHKQLLAIPHALVPSSGSYNNMLNEKLKCPALKLILIIPHHRNSLCLWCIIIDTPNNQIKDCTSRNFFCSYYALDSVHRYQIQLQKTRDRSLTTVHFLDQKSGRWGIETVPAKVLCLSQARKS